MALSGKRVLITGADGFIGSHLAERLVAEGCRVRAFAYYNSFGTWGWLDRCQAAKEMEVLLGDIRDSLRVREAAADVDVIFHLAALIGIPYSYHAPDSYIDTNVRGTLNVLQAARDCETPRILVTSTSEVYGTARTVPIDEGHPRTGQSPYSATKIAADAMAEAYHRSFGLPVSIVRPFNTYGPRQSARAVIPTIISQLLAGEQTVRLGSRHPTRDLVFVKDTVEGFVRIARCDAAVGMDVNIATGYEISVGDLAQKLIALIAPGVSVVEEAHRVRPADSEVERLLGATDRLRKLTGWVPQTALDDGLAATIEWFRSTSQSYRHNTYNV